MINNKSDFFAKAQLKRKTISVDDIGEIEIHELNVAQRFDLPEISKGNPVETQIKIIIMGCDLFDDSDLDSLKNLPYDAVKNICDEIIILSGLGTGSVSDSKKN